VSVLIANRTPGFDEIYFLDDIPQHSSIGDSVQLPYCSFSLSAFCLSEWCFLRSKEARSVAVQSISKSASTDEAATSESRFEHDWL
jgi:hypothetical protein